MTYITGDKDLLTLKFNQNASIKSSITIYTILLKKRKRNYL